MAAVTPAPPRSSAAAHDERGSLARIAGGALFTVVGSVISALATFAFAVVVTRTTSQRDAGVYFSLSSVFLLGAALCRLGVPMGLVYVLSRLRAAGQQRLMRPFVRHAYVAVSGVALLLGLAGVLAAGPIAQTFARTRSGDAVTLVRVLAGCLIFSALMDAGVGATRGLGTVRPTVLIDQIGRPVAQVLLALLFAGLGVHSSLGTGLAWVLPWVPSALLIMLWTARRRTRQERRAGQDPVAHLDRSQRRGFWRFVAPRSLGAIAQLVLQRADILLLGVLRGPREAAIYTAATRFLVFGQLISNAIGTTIQSRLAQLMARNDRAGARAVYRAATGWIVLSSWPIYLLSAVFSQELLTVFGRGYRTGADVILVLSLIMLVATGTGAVDVVLAMAGRGRWTMTNALVALAVDIGLNLVLIPRLGILGAALAWAAAIAINNVTPLVQLTVSLGVHPFGSATSAAMALALLCFGALPLGVRLVLGHDLVLALVTAAVGGVLYIVLVWRARDLFELHLPALRPRRLRVGTR